MAKKTEKKKKAFQRACRANVEKGLINHADGSWKPFRTDSRMDQMMRDGYRL